MMFSRSESRAFVAVFFTVAGLAISACSGGGGASIPSAPSGTASAAAAGAPHSNPTATPSSSGGGTAPSPTPTGSPTARAGLPSATPTPSAEATATPSATPTPAPTATATEKPTSPPAASPTPSPQATTNAGVPYDPPAGDAPYYSSSVFAQQIPNPPPVNANSAAWTAAEAQLGSFGIGDMVAYKTRAPDASELAFPIYLNHQGSNTPVKIHCTKNYGGSAHPCNVEGLTVYIDPRELPQQGGEPAGGTLDAHWAIVDAAAGYEYDTWETSWPPKNGVLTVGWGGRCALNGDGFTNPSYAGPSWNAGCTGDASGTPLSMGTIRAKDLLAAAANGGVLPRALNYFMGCPGTSGGALPAPFLGSGDGTCSGAPPEGSHLYLAMHDAQVNALGLAPILSVILRTLDEDHYGAFVTDRASQASPVISLNVESDETYAAWGLPSPWLNQFIPEAQKEGLQTYSTSDRIGVELPVPPSITWSQMRFM